MIAALYEQLRAVFYPPQFYFSFVSPVYFFIEQSIPWSILIPRLQIIEPRFRIVIIPTISKMYLICHCSRLAYDVSVRIIPKIRYVRSAYMIHAEDIAKYVLRKIVIHAVMYHPDYPACIV